MVKLNKRMLVVISTFLVVIGLDQITKILVRVNLDFGETINLIPGFFNLTYRLNPGVAFSMFSDLQAAPYIFSLVALVAIIFVFRFTKKNLDLPMVGVYGLGMIAGGAGGNMFDRLLPPHKVLDFIDCFYKGYHWPAFNIADSAICIGAAMLFVLASIHKK